MDMNHIEKTSWEVPKDIDHKSRINWVTENVEKFCVLPWININTNPNGNVKLCCSIAMDDFVNDCTPDRPHQKIFNLGYDDIRTIWNSVYMQHTRKMHRENVGVNVCSDCYRIEKVSGHSPRKGQNIIWVERKKQDEELDNYFTKVSDDNSYVFTEQLPISLELRLGNQCNLKCVSCWGMSSSLIQEERKEILISGKLLENNLLWLHNRWEEEVDSVDRADVKEWYETETFYNNFKLMAPKLRRLYTTGGEPTLIKANYRMLEELIAVGNTKCRVEFTSNMTTYNPKFYEALEQFDEAEIQMSIDGIGPLAEYIRYGCEWEKVKENIIKIATMAANKPNWKVNVYTVLQAMNYQHITSIWNFLEEVTLLTGKKIYWWPITMSHPSHLSLAVLPIEERLTAIPKIKEESKKYTIKDMDPIDKFALGSDAINALIDPITNMPFDESLSKKYINYKKFLDSYRESKNG